MHFNLILFYFPLSKDSPSLQQFLTDFLVFFITQKSIAPFFIKVGFGLISLHSFLTTERHPSDVEPSYILLIFRLIQSVVYPVSVSKDCCSCLIDYNSKDLVWILTKILRIIAFGCLKSVPNFHQIGVWVCELEQFFKCAKRWRRKKQESLLTHFLEMAYTIFFKVSLSRRAPPQQLWHSSDKRSRSYKWVKIVTLLFL